MEKAEERDQDAGGRAHAPRPRLAVLGDQRAVSLCARAETQSAPFAHPLPPRSGINVCAITAGSESRKVVCWGETSDIYAVPHDLEPASSGVLPAAGLRRGEEL